MLCAHELGLVPITTPAYSPRSNGLAEAFVKTFKRDDVEGAELRDAESVRAQLSGWIEDYNTRAPHSALGMRSPAEYRADVTLSSPRRAARWGALQNRLSSDPSLRNQCTASQQMTRQVSRRSGISGSRTSACTASGSGWRRPTWRRSSAAGSSGHVVQLNWMSRKGAEAMLESFKNRVTHLKRETYALYLAARHPHTPWYARLFVAGVVAYAFSPIDLIPDCVPVLGYLDDLILIPLGIVVATKLVPPQVLVECRARAQEAAANGKPVSRVAAVAIIGVWVFLAALCALWAYEVFALSHQRAEWERL